MDFDYNRPELVSTVKVDGYSVTLRLQRYTIHGNFRTDIQIGNATEERFWKTKQVLRIYSFVTLS